MYFSTSYNYYLCQKLAQLFHPLSLEAVINIPTLDNLSIARWCVNEQRTLPGLSVSQGGGGGCEDERESANDP